MAGVCLSIEPQPLKQSGQSSPAWWGFDSQLSVFARGLNVTDAVSVLDTVYSWITLELKASDDQRIPKPFPPNSKTVHSFKILKHKLRDAAASWIAHTLSMTVKGQIWSMTEEYHTKGSVVVLNVITDRTWSDSRGRRLSGEDSEES